jgi:excisionase family DNA binding protein
VTDRVILPIPGVGTLVLDGEAYREALEKGALISAVTTSQAGGGTEPLFTAEQLSEQLGIPASWLEQAARESRIPSLQFGRWRRFSRRAVEAAVDEEGNLTRSQVRVGTR